MSKHKFGRHITSLSSVAKESLRYLSEINGVSRVLPGIITASRGKSHPTGLVSVQRVDEHIIHCALFDEGRLIEVAVVLGIDTDASAIVVAIEAEWPQQARGRKHRQKRRVSNGKGGVVVFKKRKFGTPADYRDAERGPTLADVWPTNGEQSNGNLSEKR